MLTGIDPAVVLFRLWLGPILLVTVLVVAALARQVAGRWWAGPVTAGVAVLARPLLPGGPAAVPGGSPVSLLSPSETYLLPFLILLTALCVELVRDRPLGRGWFLVGPLALACAGAKASGLPVLIAGVAVASVARFVVTRTVGRRALLALGVLVAALGAGLAVFVGGGAGGLSPQALSELQWIAPYAHTIAPHAPTAPGPLPPGLATAGTKGWLFALGIVGWWLLLQSPRLVGLATLGRRPGRTDPAVWLLAGATVAGTGAMWSLFHPSDSQAYFLLPVLPFAALLTVLLLPVAATERYWRPVLAAGAAGLVLAGVLRLVAGRHGPGPASTYRGWAAGLAGPVLVALAVAAALVVGWWLACRYRPGGARLPGARLRGAGRPGAGWRGVRLRGAGVPVAVAVLLGASLGAGAIGVLPRAARVVTGVPAPKAGSRPVTAAEIRAARWLDAHAGPTDVVATNVHCLRLVTRPYCDSRAFWVSGFGGHRTLVESWGYTDAAVAAHGRHGHSYPRQPFADPALFALDERAFAAPDAATLAELRHRYRVRWLFADRRAGPVAARLGRYARLQHTDGPAAIYQLWP
ncbi:hypothetical protein Athai_60310 [Actinocatenispora thailandica]|uniref:Uncharacterized protein n=2 Tax=Actinocatenispora thailandica TaxID=227318 RepID=A0A7R7I0Y8_9ACTN|nr:hypothetical protein Athai_60310 [Actinocatenispora thailandica]